MRIKTLLVAAALTTAPVLAQAECSWSKQTAMSCAQGMVYDHDSGSCVKVTG